jgi:hypothetical protein
MDPLLQYLTCQLRLRFNEVRHRLRDDAGYSTETVIVTALLAALGLAVVGIIVAKVTKKANGINLG